MTDASPEAAAPAVRLFGIVNGSLMTAAVGAAADLGIADRLAAGARSSADLAEEIGEAVPAAADWRPVRSDPLPWWRARGGASAC